MRVFLISFLLAGLACFALWRHLKEIHAAAISATDHRATSPAPPPPDISPVRAMTPQTVVQLWQGVSRKAPATAAQWAALDAVSDADIPAWAKSLIPDHYGLLRRAVMVRWAAIDGPSAMAHARSQGREWSSLLPEMLACWIRRDPTGCAAEIRSLTLNEDWLDAQTTLAQTSLTGALDMIARQLTSGMKENNEWTEIAHPGYLGHQMRDPARNAEFLRWLSKCSDPIVAARVFSVVFSSMDHEDAWLRPERMPDYMPGAKQMPQKHEHPDTVWTMGALAEGLNPLTSLRDKDRAPYPQRTDAPEHYSLFTRLYQWAGRDPESAGLWLKVQTPSPQLDQAARGYLQAVASENPAAAVLWAATISQPGERVRSSADHYAAWHARQPAEAESWLTAAGFTETQRLYIAGKAIAGRKLTSP